VVPLPYPESSQPSIESEPDRNYRSKANDENGSTEMQGNLSSNLDNVFLYDDKNENAEASDNQNGNSLPVAMGESRPPGAIDETVPVAMDENVPSAMDENLPSAIDGNVPCAMDDIQATLHPSESNETQSSKPHYKILHPFQVNL
jgi:hypothetical protein